MIQMDKNLLQPKYITISDILWLHNFKEADTQIKHNYELHVSLWKV